MRAVWVDAGNDADVAKLRQYGIVSPYFDVRDPRVTKSYLQAVRAETLAPGVNLKPGVYAAWNWPEVGMSGAAFAEWLSAKCAALFAGTAPGFPSVCADIETHDVDYLLAFWRRWRELRPHRQTDWTLEGFQGGLFSYDEARELAHLVHDTGTFPGFVVPQNYGAPLPPDGSGETRYQPLAADRVALDLVSHGFPTPYLYGFYDGAELPSRWEGYVFTQGRLP
jgi:hypothetical protein